MNRINTKDELIEVLEIDSEEEFKDEKNQNKLLDLLRENRISPKLAKDLLSIVPDLTKAFTVVISTMGEIGKSLDAVKKHRWSILKEMAASGTLNSEQIIEAMRIIQEIEEKEHIDWKEIVKMAFAFVGGLAVLAVALTSGGEDKQNS